MSLSTQLSRGALALPLLAAFALLALTSPPAASADQLPTTVTAVTVIAQARHSCELVEHRFMTLRLAAAPADLGNLSARWGRACRA
ncbi:MAG TPA: hypothetical protein VKM35_07960 [Arenimonas sp.]|uniref:hypothetical protein n=1 Tax=Arenimonas sp. TaxID=1872635 RepID=UPI002CF014EA|nr:hypothetical protein [Arenimonas sp.]HMB57131.1 hypothetical protein [Arenimonas sp.]